MGSSRCIIGVAPIAKQVNVYPGQIYSSLWRSSIWIPDGYPWQMNVTNPDGNINIITTEFNVTFDNWSQDFWIKFQVKEFGELTNTIRYNRLLLQIIYMELLMGH
jgi:hypothetical protein